MNIFAKLFGKKIDRIIQILTVEDRNMMLGLSESGKVYFTVFENGKRVWKLSIESPKKEASK